MKEDISIGIAVLAIVISIVAIASTVIVKPVSTIGANSVSGNELADNSVTSGKVVDGTLTDADISDSGISKIASSSITLQDLTSEVIAAMTGVVDIANNSITTAKIADGTITNVDISDSADIDPSKILGTAWTSANDGSGSGLDADTVDGKDVSAFVNKSGDTMTGSLVLNADPTADLEPATKQYVDNRTGTTVSTYSLGETLTATASTILEDTINAPSDGYIIAYTTGDLSGDCGTSWAAASIFLTDDPAAITSTMKIRAYLSSNTVGIFEFPFSVVGRFTATEGSNTIYVRGYSEGADTLNKVWSINLVLMFVPN